MVERMHLTSLQEMLQKMPRNVMTVIYTVVVYCYEK